MLNPETLATVRHVRQELYGCLGHRQDSLFELTDAVLTAAERRPLVRFSLGPAFRRGWPSTCDALADGSVDLKALRSVFQANLAPPADGERPVWALDGTHWPRPAAATSPERTYARRVASGQPRDGVVPAWAYHWLGAAPEAHGSWVLPLDVRRRGPSVGLPTSLAITHLEAAATEPCSVLRVQVEHLPRRAGAPAPLWLAWIGGQLPTDLLQVWRWYQRRFAAEHGFRFLKQSLGWTTVRLRSPQAADRWTWLLAAGLWQLWLIRPLVAEVRLPWDHPAAPEQLTPGRVRRAFGSLLVRLSSPARAPRSRGKSPGRRPGQTCGPRERFAVVRRTPAKARDRHRNRRRSARA